MKIQELYKIFQDCSDISTDSRNIPKNCLFFALKGDNFDGNKFVKSAIDLGAKYAVISNEKYQINDKTILVDDTLKTLQELAKFHRQQIGVTIVGITGTNGKTTTKELVAAVLSKKFNVFATEGNFNNHIGVPLTLLSLNEKVEIAVVEMGANHLGEIAELCEIAEPDMGLITNIGKAHLEGFGNLENLITTKLGLFEAIKQKEGMFFLNSNDEILKNRIKSYKNIVEYGNSDVSVVKSFESCDSVYLKFIANIENENYEVETKLIGKYNIDNVLAAIAVGIENKINIDKIIDAIEKYEPANNRSQLKKTDKNTLILDMYNANPTSMFLSLQNFAEMDLSRKVLIVGDMLEVGNTEKEEHQKIINQINKNKYHKVFLIGKIFKNCDFSEEYHSFENIDLYIDFLKQNELKNCSILLKASNGTGLKKCVEFL